MAARVIVSSPRAGGGDAMSDDLRELAKLDYEASIKEAADRLHFQQEIGLTPCKSGILVNGGAIIGLLTFIGNQPAI